MTEKEIILAILRRLGEDCEILYNNIEFDCGKGVQVNFDFDENGNVTDIYCYNDYY